MKIGIVGANSQVGTELCFLLDAKDEDVVPITRNELGAAVFDYHGFETRIGDVANTEDAKRVLNNLDMVVVSAFAPYFSRGELSPKQARTSNEALVENSVTQSHDDAIVIYFSSLAAFGSTVRNTDWWWYTREKRHIERNLFAADGDTQRTYAFRLGHVFGPHQGITKDLKSDLDNKQEIHLNVDPERPSNAVHTVTIADAILTAAQKLPDSDTYTIVNSPNWSWRKVLEFYSSDEGELVFHKSDNQSSKRQSLRRSLRGLFIRSLRTVPIPTTTLLSISVYLPERVYSRVWDSAKTRRVGAEIEKLRNAAFVDRDMFHYDPVPGPFIQDLNSTENELKTAPYVEFLDGD